MRDYTPEQFAGLMLACGLTTFFAPYARLEEASRALVQAALSEEESNASTSNRPEREGVKNQAKKRPQAEEIQKEQLIEEYRAVRSEPMSTYTPRQFAGLLLACHCLQRFSPLHQTENETSVLELLARLNSTAEERGQ
jgi:hypothetical protein